MIETNGWYEVRQEGGHKHFKHPSKPGLTTVPHPYKDIRTGTLKSIERQSGVKLK